MESVTTSQPSIVVAATHRSGSYLACDWLSQLGGIPFPEEYFNFNLLAARQELLLSDDLPLADVLTRLMAHQCETHGRFAVKAMWPAFESLFSSLAMESGVPSGGFAEVAFEWLGPMKFIFIRRRDKVRQAVSFEKAKQTGVWRKSKGEAVGDAALVYSYPRILDCWNQIHEDERAWLAFFKTHNLPYREIWYEEMVEDPMGVLGDALSFLGVKPEVELDLKSRFQKLGGGLNLDWAKRFAQRQSGGLRAAARGSSPEGEFRGRIRCQETNPIRLSPDSATVIVCDIKNEGPLPWIPFEDAAGHASHRLEVWKRDAAEGEDALWTSELDRVVLPGESIELPLRLEVSVVPEDFQCELIFRHPDGELCMERGLCVEIELDEKWRCLRQVFGELSASDQTDWVKVPVLGDIWIASFPFIFQREQGWWYMDTEHSSLGIFCAQDFAFGYFALHLNRPNAFDVFASDGSFRTLIFSGVRDGMREFKAAESGDLVRYPRSEKAG